MKEYRSKTLLTGYKIGLPNPDKYVGVPTKYGYPIKVYYKNQIMFIRGESDNVSEEFQDKNGGEPYTLSYYHWEPVKTTGIFTPPQVRISQPSQLKQHRLFKSPYKGGDR